MKFKIKGEFIANKKYHNKYLKDTMKWFHLTYEGGDLYQAKNPEDDRSYPVTFNRIEEALKNYGWKLSDDPPEEWEEKHFK